MTLQNLVFKLVPNFFWKQLKKQMRKNRKANNSQKTIPNSKYLQRKNATRNYLKILSKICTEFETISIVLNYVPMSEIQGVNLKPSTSEFSTQLRNIENKDFKSYNAGNCVFKRYFRCPAKATLSHLKKLMEIKLAMSEPYTVYFIDNSFVNVLDEELSLQDLVYIYSWNRKAPLNISFTIVRLNYDEDCPPVLDIEIMPQLRPETSNQTINKINLVLNNNDDSNNINLERCNALKDEEQIPPILRIPQLHVSLPPSAFDSNGVCAIQPHSIIKTTSTNVSPPSLLKAEKAITDSKKQAQPQRKRRKNSTPLKSEEAQNNIKKTGENLSSFTNTNVLSTTSTITKVAEKVFEKSFNPNTTLSEYLNMPQRYQLHLQQQEQNSHHTVAQQLQQQRSMQQKSNYSENNVKEAIKNNLSASKTSISALKSKLNEKTPEMIVPSVSTSLMPSFGTNPATSLAAYALLQQQQNSNAAAAQHLMQQAAGNCGNFNSTPYAFFNSFLNPQFAAAASHQFVMNNAANFLNNTNVHNICSTSTNSNLLKKSPSKKAKISNEQKLNIKKVVSQIQNNDEISQNVPLQNFSKDILLENQQAIPIETKTPPQSIKSSLSNVETTSLISKISNKFEKHTPICPIAELSLKKQIPTTSKLFSKTESTTKNLIIPNNNPNSYERLSDEIPSLFQKKSSSQTLTTNKSSKLNSIIDAAVAANRVSATNSLTPTKPTLAS